MATPLRLLDQSVQGGRLFAADQEDGNLPVHLASFHQVSEPSEVIHVTRPVALLICCDSYIEWLQTQQFCPEAAPHSVAPAAAGIWAAWNCRPG